MQIILQPILVQESKDSISILENLLAELFNASVSIASPLKRCHFNYSISKEINGNQIKYYSGF